MEADLKKINTDRAYVSSKLGKQDWIKTKGSLKGQKEEHERLNTDSQALRSQLRGSGYSTGNVKKKNLSHKNWLDAERSVKLCIEILKRAAANAEAIHAMKKKLKLKLPKEADISELVSHLHEQYNILTKKVRKVDTHRLSKFEAAQK